MCQKITGTCSLLPENNWENICKVTSIHRPSGYGNAPNSDLITKGEIGNVSENNRDM